MMMPMLLLLLLAGTTRACLNPLANGAGQGSNALQYGPGCALECRDGFINMNATVDPFCYACETRCGAHMRPNPGCFKGGGGQFPGDGDYACVACPNSNNASYEFRFVGGLRVYCAVRNGTSVAINDTDSYNNSYNYNNSYSYSHNSDGDGLLLWIVVALCCLLLLCYSFYAAADTDKRGREVALFRHLPDGWALQPVH